MGYCHAELVLENPAEAKLEPFRTTAVADTGAGMLVVPEHVAVQLALQLEDEPEVTLADGSVQRVRQMGPVRVRFKNRVCSTSAMVMGNEVLLGAIPMQLMDLVVYPREERVDVNPNSPNFAHHRAK